MKKLPLSGHFYTHTQIEAEIATRKKRIRQIIHRLENDSNVENNQWAHLTLNNQYGEELSQTARKYLDELKAVLSDSSWSLDVIARMGSRLKTSKGIIDLYELRRRS